MAGGEQAGGGLTLLPATTIAGAVAGQVGSATPLFGRASYLLIEAAFAYGAGGATVKAWVQTRVRGGAWRDVASFAFATTAATKWSAVHRDTALAAAQAASDAALADDSILNGLLGDELRVKYTSTGTYTGATSLAVRASVKS